VEGDFSANLPVKEYFLMFAIVTRELFDQGSYPSRATTLDLAVIFQNESI
jgi:hypothetical protein